MTSAGVDRGRAEARVDLGDFAATIALDAGPRILRYGRTGSWGPSMFASLPDAMIDHPAAGEFRFLGGHRLWRAPEEPAVTYQPDHRGVAVHSIEGGVEVEGPTDGAGLTKAMTLRSEGDTTVVDHVIFNRGATPLQCAAWAITQLTPGGTAILPQPLDTFDADGALPNRYVVLWPYTDPASPELKVGRADIRVEATAAPSKTKIGQPNRRGWLAYLLGDELFVKWSPLHRDGLQYPDMGASVQCYRDERFLELETLGPLVDLEPGDSVSHREVWTLRPLDGAALDDVLDALPTVPDQMQA